MSSSPIEKSYIYLNSSSKDLPPIRCVDTYGSVNGIGTCSGTEIVADNLPHSNIISIPIQPPIEKETLAESVWIKGNVVEDKLSNENDSQQYRHASKEIDTRNLIKSDRNDVEIQNTRTKEESQKINNECINRGSRRKDDNIQGNRSQEKYHGNQKEETFRGGRKHIDYRNRENSYNEDRGIRTSSRDLDEHCYGNFEFDKTEQRRFSRSYYREPPTYRHSKSLSRSDHTKFERNQRSRSPYHGKGDRTTRSRAPSRLVHGPSIDSKNMRESKILVSPPPRERYSDMRRSRNTQRSRNSSYERQSERNHDIDRHRRFDASDPKKRDSSYDDWQEKCRNSEENYVACNDRGRMECKNSNWQQKSSQPLGYHGKDDHLHHYQKYTKDGVGDSKWSDKTINRLGNTMNNEIRICQSPDHLESTAKLIPTDTCIKIEVISSTPPVEMSLKLSQGKDETETGPLTVFDDPRLHSKKYFNEDEIESNKLLKLTKVKQLKETPFRCPSRKGQIFLKILTYTDETESHKTQKQPSTQNDLNKELYKDIDSQFSDTSAESGELDDSCYFDSRCEQIKKAVQMEWLATSSEVTEKKNESQKIISDDGQTDAVYVTKSDKNDVDTDISVDGQTNTTKSDKNYVDTKLTKNGELCNETCSNNLNLHSSSQKNGCSNVLLKALTKNIDLDTPTNSDGESTKMRFVTSTPNPRDSPQHDQKIDPTIQSPIKESLESIKENSAQVGSSVPDSCIKSNNMTLSNDIAASSVPVPQFIITRRRRVIVKS